MKYTVLFYLIAYLSVANSNDKATVEYYENLIMEETARAFVYPLPEDASEYKPNSDESTLYNIFDYIIVGAGSAGSVIANRISKNKGNKILLLEAGGEETDFTDIPGVQVLLQGLEFNWNYNSIEQTTSCLGLFNKSCPYPRGKVEGGSSTINVMMYVRGNRRDYDNWCNQGNPGWCYEDVLKLFKKSENSHINGDPGYHGKGGNLNVGYHIPNNRQYQAFIEANVELGRKIVDYNGKEQMGVAETQFTVVNGRRDSTAKVFLNPAMGRPNLEILPHSFVIKLLICPCTKTAYGVLFSHHGKLYIAKARKEVIVSTGAIGSPQLLMLSGIGPESHLKDLGIPVIQSLAVGDNFQEHPTYFTLQAVSNYTQPDQTLEESVKEFLNGVGKLTIAGNSQGVCFVQTNMTNITGYPDIQLIMSASKNSTNFIQRSAHYDNETYNAIVSGVNSSVTFSMVTMLLHPKSRGTVRLKSSSPYDYPLIDPKLLSDSEGDDIERLYQGVQLAIELLSTNAFKKLNATLRYLPLPACLQHEPFSKDYWYCVFRQMVSGIFHPVGTCKMGPDPRNGAVVDHELKVHGIRNLRVADASIMPDIPSGNTNAASIMIGEKAAELIMSELNFYL